MKPVGLTSNKLARELHISVPRVNDIVLERRSITDDTAINVARYLGQRAAPKSKRPPDLVDQKCHPVKTSNDTR